MEMLQASVDPLIFYFWQEFSKILERGVLSLILDLDFKFPAKIEMAFSQILVI